MNQSKLVEKENSKADLIGQKIDQNDIDDQSSNDQSSELPTAEFIKAWLIDHLSKTLEIAPEKIDETTVLDRYGLDSLAATVLTGDLADWLGFDVEFTLFYDYPTISAVATYLEENLKAENQVDTTEISQSHSPINLSKEVVLDPELTYGERKYLLPKETQTIFLTGSTGFLGAFLLAKLLKQTQAEIYCLVRAENLDSGHHRIRENLTFYRLWEIEFSHRVKPILGDLAQTNFGLSADQFQSLAEHVEVIYHGGALLNYIYSYEQLKPINVIGTQEVLRLASIGLPKLLHYISSTAVFDYHRIAYGQPRVNERTSLNCTEGMYLGYSQSKWVAEKLVHIAMERGLIAHIYRPGFIGGHSQTGIVNHQDIIWRLINGSIQMGCIPEMDMELTVNPIDQVSQNIVALSRHNWPSSEIFHLTPPPHLSWNNLGHLIQDYGYPIQSLPLEQWLGRLEQIAISEATNPLYPLLPFFLKRWSFEQLTMLELMQLRKSPQIDCQETLNKLDQITQSNPTYPTGRDLWHAHFDYLINQGVLSRPNSKV
ncbi:MAG: thioester reductase domain-containing protein [Cyanobacteria bacterium P01_C01_bin.118]